MGRARRVISVALCLLLEMPNSAQCVRTVSQHKVPEALQLSGGGVPEWMAC